MAKASRGRLSSLDLLPIEAEEDVVWAYGQLRDRKETQDDIRDSLNVRLAAKGLPPISRSAFNRAAMRTARMAHRLGEVKEIATALATKFEDGSDESLTLLVAETIKSLIFEMMENTNELPANGLTAEMMMNLSRALNYAEGAKKISADTKKLVEREFKQKAEGAIAAVAARQGLSKDRVDELRREFLGLEVKPK